MNKFDNKLDRLEGKVKETVGKATNQEDLELEGKLKILKSDMVLKGEDLKEKVQAKANDFIDKIRDEQDKV
ncbi:MAG: CsbD family protein [Anaerocolumna sp.]